MRRAQQGDEDAFTILIDRYDRRLLYYVRRLLNEVDEAFDVVQSTWLAAYRRLGKLRSPKAFRVWIFRIAHDQSVSALRRKGIRPASGTMDLQPVEVMDGHLQPVEEALENAQLVHHALPQISLEHRQVLTLRFLEDMTLEEISEVLDCPAGTIKSRLHYAKLALRCRIEELLND